MVDPPFWRGLGTDPPGTGGRARPACPMLRRSLRAALPAKWAFRRSHATGQVTGLRVHALPLVLVADRPGPCRYRRIVWVQSLVLRSCLQPRLRAVLSHPGDCWSDEPSARHLPDPGVAILLGALVLGERLAPQHLIGMALIGCGLAAIDGRVWAFSQQRRGAIPPEMYQGGTSERRMTLCRPEGK